MPYINPKEKKEIMNTLSLRSITSKCLMGCALLSFVLSLAIVPGRAAFAASVTCKSWSIVSSPNPSPYYNHLVGVTAISANDAWAVGSEIVSVSNDGNTALTLTAHWNGTGWKAVASPNAAASQSYLVAVTAVSARDVWAVGSYASSSSFQTLIEHWNGRKWSIVPSPNPSSFNDTLVAVTAISANDVWAVGQYNDTSNHVLALIEHWNGRTWSVVSGPAPGPGSARFFSVAAVSASDVWVVGSYQPTRRVLPVQTLTEHWNGTTWQVVASPDAANSTADSLSSVTRVPDSRTLWAVGSDNLGFGEPLLEYWNGNSWSIVPNSIPSSRGGSSLSSLVALSANNVWAVGTTSNSALPYVGTLIAHWNGTSWNVVSSPNGTGDSSFTSVARVPDTSKLWTVGYSYFPGGSGSRTFIVSYCPEPRD